MPLWLHVTTQRRPVTWCLFPENSWPMSEELILRPKRDHAPFGDTTPSIWLLTLILQDCLPVHWAWIPKRSVFPQTSSSQIIYSWNTRLDTRIMSSSEGNGKPGFRFLEKGGQEPDSSYYRLRKAAVAAVHNCLGRARSAFTLSVYTPGYALGVLRSV